MKIEEYWYPHKLLQKTMHVHTVTGYPTNICYFIVKNNLNYEDPDLPKKYPEYFI